MATPGHVLALPCSIYKYPDSCVSTVEIRVDGNYRITLSSLFFKQLSNKFSLFRINKSHNADEEPPYNFRHVLDFTEQDELFKVC
jgi:hypothetical protein